MSGIDKAYKQYSEAEREPMPEAAYGNYAEVVDVEEEETEKGETSKPLPFDGVQLLTDAATAISTDRNDTHGSKSACFQAMADYLNFHFTNMVRNRKTHIFKAWDAALIMDGFKTARILAGQSDFKDHWMDKAGYVGCGWDIISPKEEKKG